MAGAFDAIKGFFHLFVGPYGSSRRVVTILDVLGPRVPQA